MHCIHSRAPWHPKSSSRKLCFPKDVLNLHEQILSVLMGRVITELHLSDRADAIKEWNTQSVQHIAFLWKGFTLSSEVSSYLPQCNNTTPVQLSLLHYFPVSKTFNCLKAISNAARFPVPHFQLFQHIPDCFYRTVPSVPPGISDTPSTAIQRFIYSKQDNNSELFWQKDFLLPPFCKTSNKQSQNLTFSICMLNFSPSSY